MFIWLHCRHEEVRWIDAYTCRCNECGKTGIWFEEGLVLWCKRRGVDSVVLQQRSALPPPIDLAPIDLGVGASGLTTPSSGSVEAA